MKIILNGTRDEILKLIPELDESWLEVIPENGPPARIHLLGDVISSDEPVTIVTLGTEKYRIERILSPTGFRMPVRANEEYPFRIVQADGAVETREVLIADLAKTHEMLLPI